MSNRRGSKKKKPEKIPLVEREAISPPSGVKKNPPEVGDVVTIFNDSAPTMDEIDHLPQSHLSTALETAQIPHIEKRITLLARLVLEHTLWNPDGLTKKERADIALNAIRTLEGSKSTLWVEDPNEKNLPKNKEALANEKKRIEGRLQQLLQQRGAMEGKISKKASEDALALMEMEVEGEEN